MAAAPRILSTAATVELVLALAIVAFFLRFQDDIDGWLAPLASPVQTSALDPCREPTEHEQLLVVVERRDGKTARVGCLYAGSQSAYPKKPRPKVAHANTHD